MSVGTAVEINKNIGPELNDNTEEWVKLWKANQDSIDGWMGAQEQQCLYNAARISVGDILEIGSFKGRSTVQLGAGLKATGRPGIIHIIDPFPDPYNLPDGNKMTGLRKEFEATIIKCGIDDRVVIHQNRSQDIADSFEDKSFGLIFIDGNHSYESVKRDFTLYSPKLADGGLLLIHDIAPKFPGVVKIAEEIENEGVFNWVTLKDSLGVFCRGAKRA